MIYVTIILICIGIFCVVFKVQIDFKSIFHRGKLLKNTQYGLRDVSGPQGSGKTAFCITKLKQYESDYILFANVKDIKNLNYTYFEGFNGLYDIVGTIDYLNSKSVSNRKYCIFFDELFTEITKHSKEVQNILKVLCQLRKRHIVLLTTCQSFPELPLWFRRLCRYEIEIHNIPLLTGSYFIAIYKDGYKIKWDEIEQDFVAPVVVTKIEKVKRTVIDSYSTDEVIKANSLISSTSEDLAKSLLGEDTPTQSEQVEVLDPETPLLRL